MKTPAEKYMNDPHYHRLVDTLEHFINQAQFTPSELREAAILACINYETKRVRTMVIDPATCEALRILDEFATREPRPKR